MEDIILCVRHPAIIYGIGTMQGRDEKFILVILKEHLLPGRNPPLNFFSRPWKNVLDVG